jgi:hypothetical protein
LTLQDVRSVRSPSHLCCDHKSRITSRCASTARRHSFHLCAHQSLVSSSLLLHRPYPSLPAENPLRSLPTRPIGPQQPSARSPPRIEYCTACPHSPAIMSLSQDVTRRLASPKKSTEDTIEDKPRRTGKPSSQTGFFNRRIRLTSDSSLSLPLAIVLLFPCLVLGLIVTLFWRSPDPEGLMNMPAGTPPSIRYVSRSPPSSGRRPVAYSHPGKSARSMTKSSPQGVSSLKSTRPERMPPSLS